MAYHEPIHIDPADKSTAAQGVIKLCQSAYPAYRGRSYQLQIVDYQLDLRSYWDGGSRSKWAFVKLDGSATSPPLPDQHPVYDRPVAGLEGVTLPEGTGVVEHAIFCGKDMGLTLCIGPKNAARLLPNPEVLPCDQLIVLEHTRSLKNTYAGVTNLRFVEAHKTTGITRDRWEVAATSLIGTKHLRKNRSITPKGRNACRPYGSASC
jgi:hypothetical protein